MHPGRIVVAVGLLAVVACGGGGTDPEGSHVVSVEGEWVVSISSMVGRGIACSFDALDPNDIRLLLYQDGSRFGGDFIGKQYNCLDSRDAWVAGADPGPRIHDGRVHDLDVAFEAVDFWLGADPARFTGTVDAEGTRMAGVLEATIVTQAIGEAPVPRKVNATWSAVRR